ncbi:MAG: T9SS type A sorting domain-containing protein [Bacteroidia bacterium]|nr:T9SS type A sorting domain-containing protein [Bacteroidia bacterium]
MRTWKCLIFLTTILLNSNTGYSQHFEKLGSGLRVSGTILCMEKDTIGDRMFVAGEFETIENLDTKTIAYRDNSGWHAMANTFNYYVRDMQYVNGRLYVGGNIETIDGVTMNNICYYDSTGWHQMGQGLNGVVTSIEYYDSSLYVSGYFTVADNNLQVNGIAKWDGNTWSSVGTGADYAWVNIKVLNDTLYAYGFFNTFNGMASRNLVKFDGNTWIPMPLDTLHEIRNITYCNGTLFATMYSLTTNNSSIYKKSGTNWQGIPGPGLFQVDYIFCPLTTYNNIIYSFHRSLTEYDSLIISMYNSNGTYIGSFSSIGNTVNYPDWYFGKVIQDTLFFGGEFRKINNELAAGVSCLKNATYSSPFFPTLGYKSGYYAHGYGIYFDSTWNKLLVGGRFEFAGDSVANSIATWDGTKWEPVGTGVNAMDLGSGFRVRNFVRYNNQLYVGGNFSQAGNKSTGGFAVWNGTDWDSVGSGKPEMIRDMVTFNNKLFVAGTITEIADLNNVHGVAKFDGTTWSKLPQLSVNNDYVASLCVFNNMLYASGKFGSFPNYYYFARSSNGNNWDSLAIPGNQIVTQMMVLNNKLYLAASAAIYRYDGTTWQTVVTSAMNWTGGFRLGNIGNNLIFGNLDNSDTYILNDQDSVMHLFQYTMYNSLSIDSSTTFLTGFIPYAYYLIDPMNHIIKIHRELPSTSFIYNPDSICDHEYVHFGFDSLSHITQFYEWQFPGGLPSLSTAAYTDVKYSNPGLYDVRLKLSNGFGSDSIYLPNLIYVANCSTGEPEFQESHLKIYPNPSSGQLNIEQPSNLGLFFSTTIYDFMGRVVFSTNNEDSNTQGANPLDISFLPSGMYTVKVYTDKYSLFNTFIKL